MFLGAEMGLWAVRAITSDPDVDEVTALTVLRERVERLGDEVIESLADSPWLLGLDDGEDLIEVLTNSDSTTYRNAAISQVKEAIMVTAVEILFGGRHRERTRFVDSANVPWIITGLTPGDTPTNSCYAIAMLSEVGVSAETISTPTKDATLCCPKCNGTDELGSIETVKGFCHIEVFTESSDDGWQFSDQTNVDWDKSTSAGWRCRCGWVTGNAKWIEQFSAPTQ